jgi:hypothetical protein
MVTTRPSLGECRYAVVIVMIAIAGCAHEPRRSGLGVSAPNPNGCYVFLYDRSDWQGAGVALNGPARWPKLNGLFANHENWRNRTRSVDVGPAATDTVYTDAAFQGSSRGLSPTANIRASIMSFPLGSSPSALRARKRLSKTLTC